MSLPSPLQTAPPHKAYKLTGSALQFHFAVTRDLSTTSTHPSRGWRGMRGWAAKGRRPNNKGGEREGTGLPPPLRARLTLPPARLCKQPAPCGNVVTVSAAGPRRACWKARSKRRGSTFLVFGYWGGWWVDVVEGGHTRLRKYKVRSGSGQCSRRVRRAVVKQKHPSPAPLPPSLFFKLTRAGRRAA